MVFRCDPYLRPANLHKLDRLIQIDDTCKPLRISLINWLIGRCTVPEIHCLSPLPNDDNVLRGKRNARKSEENCARTNDLQSCHSDSVPPTKQQNSNVDIIRYDRKFPVRSIDLLIKTEGNAW